jgi:DNA-binding response OmpR family regulator
MTPPRILVVDDDPSVIPPLRVALGEENVAVDHANDIQSAVRLLTSETYCALVLDLVLEEGSGFDLLREMKERSIGIPTVVFSERLPSYVREMLHEDQVKLVFPKSSDVKLVAAVVLGLCGGL